MERFKSTTKYIKPKKIYIQSPPIHKRKKESVQLRHNKTPNATAYDNIFFRRSREELKKDIKDSGKTVKKLKRENSKLLKQIDKVQKKDKLTHKGKENKVDKIIHKLKKNETIIKYEEKSMFDAYTKLKRRQKYHEDNIKKVFKMSKNPKFVVKNKKKSI